MDDLISRQAAIDLVESFYKIDKSVLKIMVFKLKQLPSVQPETNCSEIPNNSDLISRQAAIDAISKKQDGVFDQDAEIDTAVLYVYSECKAIIKDLPSVQPEPLSDAYMKAVWTFIRMVQDLFHHSE